MTKRSTKNALFSSVFLGVYVMVAHAGITAMADTQTTQATAPSKPIEQLRWLVGGVWTADASKLPGGLARIETRYDAAANGAVIRFTTMFFDVKNEVDNSYAGNLFFNPIVNSLSMWYIDSQNEITQGQMVAAGDKWTMSFRAPGDIVGINQRINFRCDILRERTDAYRWTLDAQVDSAWKRLIELEYIRSTG